MHVIRSFGRSLNAFIQDDCLYLSASISYFLIVSIVPLSLMILALFGYFIGESQDLYQFALAGLISAFPSVTSSVTAELQNLIIFRGISFFTFLVYCFLSLQLYYSMEHAMNVIFDVPQKRHFLISILWSILIVTLVMLSLILAFTLSSFAVIFHGHPMNIFGIAVGVKLGIFLKYIAPYLLVLSVFTAIFMIVPKARVRPLHAFLGSVLVAILWDIGKNFFTWYVKNVADLGMIYGSLTTFIFALVWVYYSSCIVLLGGEFVSCLASTHRK
ncbi:MAG: YihY/virulence factor BrkB family protein [Thermodesulfovibrionia bacterium]|nr:YihY/virulence factor BrkB family protein [Thermodesulfovibrionia bacterium]